MSFGPISSSTHLLEFLSSISDVVHVQFEGWSKNPLSACAPTSLSINGWGDQEVSKVTVESSCRIRNQLDVSGVRLTLPAQPQPHGVRLLITSPHAQAIAPTIAAQARQDILV